MKHLGDITAIDWSKVEPVDVVTGGSPCQDLSVAGKRAGLAGERSGLFMEQIRCVKELRKADEQRGRTAEFIRPRYMVWENVPGAFSSGTPKGADFGAVLEELVKVVEPEAPAVSVPEKGWSAAGCLYDDMGRWSIAWRVHDAQFWGVPQRRKRIALVADFGGLSAPEILFERKGLRGDFEESRAQGQGVTMDAETGSCTANPAEHGRVPPRVLDNQQCNLSFPATPICMATQQGGAEVRIDDKASTITATGMSGNNQPVVCYPDVAHTLSARHGSPQPDKGNGANVVVQAVGFKAGNGTKANGIGWQEEVASTLSAAPSGTNQAPSVCIKEQHLFENHSQDTRYRGPLDVAPIVSATFGMGGNNQPFVVEETIPIHDQATRFSGKRGDKTDGKGNGLGVGAPNDPMNTLTSGDRHAVCYAETYQKVTGPLMANSHPGSYCGQDAYQDMFSTAQNTVRRLTPLECERLQGYPDGWTDIGEWTDSKGKKHKEADSPRYKALGNSIALPFWKWLLKRISAQYERDATFGSLFDGIGGFPLCWEQINGKGTARWASEIEEFPIAVTKIRFPEVE